MSDVSRAVRILRSGGLVAFPTETVYGLGGDATNAAAVQRIFTAKGRPPTNPLIVHVADESIARRYAADWPAAAAQLTQRFWPGPLALVVPKKDTIVDVATASLPTVGLRCPDHALALELLREFDGPIAAPSANRSTRVSPTTARHVREELGDAVDFILDGGPCRVGIESTVLDLSTTPPTVLRPGDITARQIEAEIGPVMVFRGVTSSSVPAHSPGQHARHYAPTAAAYRFDSRQIPQVADWCRENLDRAWAVLSIEPLGLDPAAADLLPIVGTSGRGPAHKFILMPNAAPEYARCLYATLRSLDQEGIDVIWVQMPPDQPQWAAVRDRLARATKPLDQAGLK